MAHHPEYITLALRAYQRCKEQQIQETGREENFREQLAELEKEEFAIVQAQIEGIKAGANPAVYNKLFADIAARRTKLVSLLEAFEVQQKANSKEQTWSPDDTTSQYAAILEDVDEVLFSEELNTWEKREIISPLVQSIVPDGADAWSIRLRSPYQGTSIEKGIQIFFT